MFCSQPTPVGQITDSSSSPAGALLRCGCRGAGIVFGFRRSEVRDVAVWWASGVRAAVRSQNGVTWGSTCHGACRLLGGGTGFGSTCMGPQWRMLVPVGLPPPPPPSAARAASPIRTPAPKAGPVGVAHKVF